MTTVRAVLLLVSVVGLSAAGKTQSKPTNADTPLSVEELKLYGDFLDSFVGTDGQSESVSLLERTVPLILSPGDADGCLKGIGSKISKAADQNFHSFPVSITKGRPVYLVDPSKKKITEMQGGLLSLSEIGFDDDHRFAVFTFKLLQAGASGLFYEQGGTLVLRKANGKWIQTKPGCSRWIT
jgi:hypothetical protein